MSDYAELDAAIVESIKAGHRRAAFINPRVEHLAKPFCRKNPWGDEESPWRIVDRRLQALRKKGVLRYGKH